MDNQPVYNDIEEKGFLVSLGGHIIDFIQTLVVFGAIFALLYLFVAQPHKVSGSSMFPYLHDGDYILTDKITYRLRTPQKGDIIVFKNPRDESQDFVKRIIGIPGDVVEINNGQVLVNNQKINEPYLPPDLATLGGNFLPEGQDYLVENNHYFVLGDNRNHSSDSREWGTITKEEIIGKAFFRYFPPQRFGSL